MVAKAFVTAVIIVLMAAATVQGWKQAPAMTIAESATEFDAPVDYQAPFFGLRVMQYVIDELALTSEQRDAVRGVFIRATPEFQQLMSSTRANHQKLMETTPSDPNYYTVIDEVSAASAELMPQAIRLSGQVRAEIHSHLSEEQQARAHELRQEVRNMVRQRVWSFATASPQTIF